MSTIQQVDPIALRQKLKKLGIGAGSELSGTFAEDAVRDTLNKHCDEAEGIRPGALVLELAELAYCLDAWARLWEAPT